MLAEYKPHQVEERESTVFTVQVDAMCPTCRIPMQHTGSVLTADPNCLLLHLHKCLKCETTLRLKKKYPYQKTIPVVIHENNLTEPHSSPTG